jgi:hypothetical protein
MATFNTKEAQAQADLLVRDRVQSTTSNGDVRFFEATYEFDGTEAATGDNIAVCEIPVGAVVLPEHSSVAFEASLGGSALAIPKIGDSADDDRYSATSISLNSSTAGRVAVTPAVATGIIARHKVTEATKTILADFTRTNAPTAGKKVKFIIAYRLG